MSLSDLLKRLANREAPRTEAEVQADVRGFLLEAPFQLEEGDVQNVLLESQLGDRRRIDVEVGSTVIEVKRDLRRGRVRDEALVQLAGYVAARAKQTGRRYAGVLTDGAEWDCYNLVEGTLQKVSSIAVSDGRADVERLTVWLEGVLATAKGVSPTASEIRARLGAGSSAHQLDRATLAILYEKNRHTPTVKLKKELWSRLLTSALGTQFRDDDELFIEHTLLVNSAEIIAHAVLGFVVEAINPNSLLTGTKFDESGIYGVVESDFFSWVLEVDDGPSFVRTLSRRLGRFDWSSVDQDVLKVLYESVIGTETRKKLGEYYTPDWLAARIVDEVLTLPLDMRVLDPACGSGTFLFHAVRKYIAHSEENGVDLAETLNGVTKNVIGMDLHPVAVTLARVTYLLAIGKARLTNTQRGTIQIPVYLGDSIQWRQQVDLWTAGNLVIRTDDNRELFSSELRFPDALLENAALFDQLVSDLSTKASNRKKGTKAPALSPTFQRLGIPTAYHSTVEATFATMCRLHDEDRDHIWAYYIRNLARPMWLAREPNRVDALIGNPPWLAYRHMTPDMQDTFREMSQARGLWEGAEVATQQDLSALFVARSIQLYLKEEGTFGFVMPNAVVDRAHYSGFRTGDYDEKSEQLRLEFTTPWDLRRIRPHIFPRGSSVVFGRRSSTAVPMGNAVVNWSGRVPKTGSSWQEVSPTLTTTDGKISRVSSTSFSPYRDRFYNGATIFPRVLFFVKEQDQSPLGVPAGRMRIESARSPNEKSPWKKVEALSGVVETEFVRPVILSECLLPFRTTAPAKAVIPLEGSKLLGGNENDLEMYPGLAAWWRQSSQSWEKHRSNDRLNLGGQLDYMSKLSKQLPIANIRVAYNKSGMHVVAAKIRDRRAVIENGLYWAATSTEDEADYLCAILNAPVTTELARPFMSYGKDERDIEKHIWQLPVPEFNSDDAAHVALAKLGREAQSVAEKVTIDPKLHFAASRRRLREALDQSSAMQQINKIVFELLS
ncbi:N-6 DNA methylase [Bradyrhizobium roseum]|uniref:N-6 DNA methylase n=1 Tax=Bradyrhizobium roseum TaxID=3056648 RepID=UPI00261B41C4|nr:N-6 DNA methylase [Bradyrhizobium roseus]WKA29329.1 N-6 DNA methylase [Bradyrhizobium roseus]